MLVPLLPSCPSPALGSHIFLQHRVNNTCETPTCTNCPSVIHPYRSTLGCVCLPGRCSLPLWKVPD